MRHLGKLALTVTALVLLAGPALAQRGGFGGGGFGGPDLLDNKSVQQELKLSEEQIKEARKAVQELRAKYKDEFAKVQKIEDESERREKFTELIKKRTEEGMKAAGDILKPGQMKRFKQILLQTRNVEAFADAEVEKALKLTDEQKEKINTIRKDTAKEVQEIFQGAQGDFQAAMKKIRALNKEAVEKATAVLTDDQKKTWKDLTGEPFEIRFEFPGGRPGGEKKKKE